MFVICKRCFEKIFKSLSEDDYIESATKNKCIICEEERILIQPTCSLDDIKQQLKLEEEQLCQ